ncbi:MAG: aldo/keto reductase [Nitrospirota bacterium]|nr:aldo/keto reductase [Nitrospirota bacterium]
MNHRQLGTSRLHVFPLGLGCMSMSEFYGHADEQESLATLHRAIEQGVNFFDTADVYGKGTNEEFIGKALKPHREKVILATKFGIVRDRKGNFVSVNGRPEYIRSSCETSLKRLGVDVIDLYYQHRVDPNTPIEETVGAMAKLVEEGKVRYLGLSEAGPHTIRKAHAAHPITALQTEYSVWCREVEDEVLPTCRELGIGFVAYSPLGRGFLTHHITSPENLEKNDARRKNPRFQGDNFEKNIMMVEALERLAHKKGCDSAQLALAWVAAQGQDIVPIPGTTKRTHLEGNIAALDIQLSTEDLTLIEEIAPRGITAGDRFPPLGMTWINL